MSYLVHHKYTHSITSLNWQLASRIGSDITQSVNFKREIFDILKKKQRPHLSLAVHYSDTARPDILSTFFSVVY